MSAGVVCACVDERHPVDPRSARNELGLSNRCRTYAVDQGAGGLCVACLADGHVGPPARYYHGGAPGLALGSSLLPPSVTGVRAAIDYADVGTGGHVRRDRVYLSTMLEAAAIFAAFHPSGRGELYEVDPVGDVEPDPDYQGAPGESVQVAEAIITRRLGRLSFEDRTKIRGAIAPAHPTFGRDRAGVRPNRHARRAAARRTR